jgi:hypothetical protein
MGGFSHVCGRGTGAAVGQCGGESCRLPTSPAKMAHRGGKRGRRAEVARQARRGVNGRVLVLDPQQLRRRGRRAAGSAARVGARGVLGDDLAAQRLRRLGRARRRARGKNGHDKGAHDWRFRAAKLCVHGRAYLCATVLHGGNFRFRFRFALKRCHFSARTLRPASLAPTGIICLNNTCIPIFPINFLIGSIAKRSAAADIVIAGLCAPALSPPSAELTAAPPRPSPQPRPAKVASCSSHVVAVVALPVTGRHSRRGGACAVRPGANGAAAAAAPRLPSLPRFARPRATLGPSLRPLAAAFF